MQKRATQGNSRVSLLSHTPEPDRLVAAAARLCYSSSSASNLLEGMGAEEEKRLICRLRQSGHLSPFEHASFSFALEGISRTCSHQLVRHRIASFSQQSQRYVSMREAQYVMPSSIRESEAARSIFEEHMSRSGTLYRELVEMGIPKEDARFVLPQAWETRMVVTMNARELLHFFELRLCRRAQWEIREVAKKMLVLAREAAPLAFEVAGPPCLLYGKCPEALPCDRPYAHGDMEALLNEE
ncbi:MAG TPA: FAD-dependent thymidylate synthase [Thermosynergistes sp.]|nr:FAD-dependent thymidylate synthase [Thermosynergistes sp.]